jgi:DNA modification methylase
MITIGEAKLYTGDCLDVLRTLPDACVQTCVTSPPYWGLRDYGVDGQMGLERTPDEYVAKMVEAFREVRRVLRDDGTLWLNIGDSYASTSKNRTEAQATAATSKIVGGLKAKDLVGIPWMLAFALRADGWYLRQDIIWHKPSPMPESVTDRCTKAHEYIFLLSKSERYYFDAKAIAEEGQGSPVEKKPAGWATEGPHTSVAHQTAKTHRKVNGGACFGKQRDPIAAKSAHAQSREFNRPIYEKRNKRSVWTVAAIGYAGAHFATFPPKLIEPCILAGSKQGDTVLDLFNGSGTTGEVALLYGRKYIGIELNPEYVELSRVRLTEAHNRFSLFNGDAA